VDTIKRFFREHLKKYTKGFWIWAGIAGMFTLIALSLLIKIFFSGNHLAKEAVEVGQRVMIHISSGDIDGNARHTRQEDKAVGTDPASQIVSKEGLAPAPLSTITEQSDKGMIPVIARDGTTPWKYYARPYTSKEKRPLIAVIFTNLGLSKQLTEDVLALPHNFTLGFSPYAGDAKTWARKAREEGFESVVDLPLEPENFPLSDPGPYGLIEDLNPTESAARLHWVLSRFPGFVGAMGNADEKLTPNVTAIRPTLTELSARGVLFLYVKTPKNTALADFAKSRSLYTLGIDVLIDDEISSAAIEKQLANLTALAKTQGYAVGMAHSFPPTTQALAAWAETLSAQGIDLVPVSAVAARVFP